MYLVGAVPVVVTGRRACLDDAVVAQDKASAVPKYIFIIKTICYQTAPPKGFFLCPVPVQKLNTFFPAFRQVVKKLDALPRNGRPVCFFYTVRAAFPAKAPARGASTLFAKRQAP